MNRDQEIERRLKTLFQKAKPVKPQEPEPRTSRISWPIKAFLAIILFLMVIQFDISITPKTEQFSKPIAYKIQTGADHQPILIPVTLNTAEAVAEEDGNFEFTLFMGCSHRRTPKPKVFNNFQFDRI